MEIRELGLQELISDPENPRKHDQKNLDAIRSSLLAYGQVEPLVVQRSTRMVIAGNGRLEVMKSMNWEKATVAMIDVDDVKARRLSIALNRSGELADWDLETLSKHISILDDLEDVSMDSLGFTDEEAQTLLENYASSLDDLETDLLQAAAEEPQEESIMATPTEELAEDLPPNTKPSDMPSSDKKVVKLFLAPDNVDKFHFAVRKLAEIYKTDNVTDTVYRAILVLASEH